MFNFLLVGPIQDSLILDICINCQIFIIELKNVIVDMFNKNMSLWSVKISICPFYLLLLFFFPSYLVIINIKSCYVSDSFKNTSVILIQNVLIILIYAFWGNTITITIMAVVKWPNFDKKTFQFGPLNDMK